MEMPRLLIADGGDEFRQILFDQLCADYSVKVCGNGLQALELLRTFRPQLLVLDLMLPGLDGISLLQRAFDEGIRPAVLVTCPYESPYIFSALQRLEVGYLMQKPCDLTAIADRLADFTAQLQPFRLPVADLNTAATNLLISMGFPTRLDGFLFLQTGIPLYMKDPGQSMTKELYVAIGAPHRKDYKQVERSIRSAIHTAWSGGDQKIWRTLFGTPDGQIPRPCNNEFFGRVTAVLSQQGYGNLTG